MRRTAFLERLALDGSADERAIRRAYARELKRIDPETDPAAFQDLREAYEAALDWARWNQAQRQELQTDAVPEPVPEAPSAGLPAQVPEGDAPIPELITPEPLPTPAQTGLPSEPTPEQAAARSFAILLQRLADLPSSSAPDADRRYRLALDSALAAPLLTNIAARDAFEWHVAKKLASGWQPGHESLLVAAAGAFGWDQDRRHLARFGPVGGILDRAVDESIAFHDQRKRVRARQGKVIARLRDPAPPSHGELIGKLAVADEIAGRFPTWFSLVTSMENLDTWRRLDDSVPGWRRRLAFNAPRRKPDPVAQPLDPGPVLKWFAAVVVVLLLRGLFETPPARKLPDMAPSEYPRVVEVVKDGDLLRIVPVRPAPDNLARLAPPSSDADRRQDQPPQVDVKQITSSPPMTLTKSTCDETVALARHYIASGVGPDAVFGPDLARRFLGDVGACIEAGMWPREPGEGGKPFGHKELADAKPQGFLGQLKTVIAQGAIDPQAADRSPRLPPATNPSAAEAVRIRALLDHYQNMPRQGRPPHLDEAEQGGSLPSPKPPPPGSGG
jgi:hypothetical protein